MKIAFGVRHFRMVGGAELFSLRLAAYLRDRGHELTVYAITGAPMDGVRLQLLPVSPLCPRFRYYWMTGRLIAEQLARADADVTFGEQKIWNANVVRPGGGVEAVFWDYYLRRKWKSERLARLVRGFYPKRYHDLAAERESLLCPSSRAIIVNSDLVRRQMIRCYPATADRIRVVHNGVVLPARSPEETRRARAEIRTRLGLDESTRLALFIGHDFYRKGLESAIRSVARANGRGAERDWHLLVAGRGRLKRYLEIARKAGAGGRVHHLGALEDSFPAYAAADVLLFPSHFDPFANVTVEALKHGLPVVTTADNGGCEVIRDGYNGWVVESPLAIERMADALVRLSAEPGLAALKANAAESARQCRLEDRLRDIEQILEGAARRRADPPAR